MWRLAEDHEYKVTEARSGKLINQIEKKGLSENTKYFFLTLRNSRIAYPRLSLSMASRPIHR